MKILVAIDGSEPSLHAVKYVAELVHRLRAEPNNVTLISVHDDTSLRHARSLVGREVIEDYLRELSEKELQPARQLLDDSGVKHDMVVRTGHVAREIAACAAQGQFDLIVLGAKGRSAIADLLIGSVAQRVLATAQTPVLLIK